MENLKIRVNNEAESKEAQELFFELGANPRSVLKDWKNSDYRSAWFALGKSGYLYNEVVYRDNDSGISCSDLYKEITLPQLREKVILKRNDRNDRTHTDQDSWSWFISGDGRGYVFGAGNANGLHRWDEASLEHVDLKPVSKFNNCSIVKTTEDARQLCNREVRPDINIPLMDFGYSCKKNSISQLNDLCDEFGCPPGAHRMSWLRQQLVTAKRATDSQSGAKEPVTMDRESARHRLAMMFRGERTTINGREVVFNASGCFDVRQDFCSGHFSTSLKATLDYLFK